MRISSLFAVAVFAAVSLAGCRNYDMPGSGPLILSPDMRAYYEQYLADSHPHAFIISDDGLFARTLTCPTVACKAAGDISRSIQRCEAESKTNCYVFAKGRSIVWQGEIRDLKEGERLTAAGAVSVPDGDVRRTWCHDALPGNRLCLALAETHHAYCTAKFDANLDGYSKCRSQKIVGSLFDGKLNPNRPDIIACDVGGDRLTEIPASICADLKGSIRQALRPLEFKWEGVANHARGIMHYIEGKAEGVATVQLDGSVGKCAGTYRFTEKGKGTWVLECASGLRASGTFNTDGDVGARGIGTDSKDRSVVFMLAPHGYEAPPEQVAPEGRGA